MLRKQRHSGERFPARLTTILLDVRMRLEMRTQIGAICKRSLAQRALVRLFSRVRSYVPLQQPGPTERLSAYIAFARQRVCSDVHLQRT